MKKVSEIMNTRVEKIHASESVCAGIEKLIDKRIRSLLVLYDGRDYGVVTIRDIMFKVLAKKEDPLKIKIGEVASKPIVTVSPDTEVEEVFNLMQKHNIARVFVEDNEEVVGVVSFFDILSYMLVQLAKK